MTSPVEMAAWGPRAGLLAALLPGLAAVATLVFTWVSVTQVSEELAISQQGQTADRYDKAIERLDSDSANIRKGAIFSLQGIMEDSPRQQPAVIYALSEYIRTRAAKKPTAGDKAPDIQAALSVLGQRDPAHDRGRTIDLRGVRLDDIDLKEADLSGANLAGAAVTDSDLEDANLSGADLRGASLRGTNLTGADLSGTRSEEAVLNDAVLAGANLSNARLNSAQLKSAVMTDADLRNAYLHKADLRQANLTDANMDGATLILADLAGANLEAVRLDGGADWSQAHRPEGDLPPAQPTAQPTLTPTPRAT
ncbi:pentapeptide repeat-containing protein [Streptomyces bicolor]|uniref:pentapeptide repeat-containing protein n=1 Tax=Streptomyces bicolor TaxID=66874 RepID=UPI000B1347C8|nr:pentapeptide repeat-containing protein [Streptomyces bicolor]